MTHFRKRFYLNLLLHLRYVTNNFFMHPIQFYVIFWIQQMNRTNSCKRTTTVSYFIEYFKTRRMSQIIHWEYSRWNLIRLDYKQNRKNVNGAKFEKMKKMTGQDSCIFILNLKDIQIHVYKHIHTHTNTHTQWTDICYKYFDSVWRRVFNRMINTLQ